MYVGTRKVIYTCENKTFQLFFSTSRVVKFRPIKLFPLVQSQDRMLAVKLTRNVGFAVKELAVHFFPNY
jgi:hypothetical protein